MNSSLVVLRKRAGFQGDPYEHANPTALKRRLGGSARWYLVPATPSRPPGNSLLCASRCRTSPFPGWFPEGSRRGLQATRDQLAIDAKKRNPLRPLKLEVDFFCGGPKNSTYINLVFRQLSSEGRGDQLNSIESAAERTGEEDDLTHGRATHMPRADLTVRHRSIANVGFAVAVVSSVGTPARSAVPLVAEQHRTLPVSCRVDLPL